MKIYSFPSLSNKESKVLLLGTMPGVQSLSMNQYYGNTRNVFWKLLFTIYNEPFTSDYEQRKNLVLKHHIAIWDVLQACLRNGSLDSAIEQEVPNDLKKFLETHPHIEYIVFNGQKAAKYFKQYVTISNKYKLVTLPSTSPANAGVSWEQKIKEWQIIKEL